MADRWRHRNIRGQFAAGGIAHRIELGFLAQIFDPVEICAAGHGARHQKGGGDPGKKVGHDGSC
jgi:hypothetical protein